MCKFIGKSNRPSTDSKPFAHWHQLKEFLLLFTPIAILVVAGTWTLGESRIKAALSTLMTEERTYVDLSIGLLDQELAVPIRHLVSLTKELPVRNIYESTGISNLNPMQQAFISLISRNPSYDKARWIDEHGRERVRVNNRNGHPVLVTENELQDKHDRYFFIDTMRLDPGVIYVSPLDLKFFK